MILKSHFTSREAAELAGFRNTHMVDYLCRSGVVQPSIRTAPGRGNHRLYTFGDLVLLRALAGLLESGLTVRRLKVALETLRKGPFRGLKEETVIERYLITDGKNVLLRDNADGLVDLNSNGQFAFAFVADVHAARESVLKTARKAPARFLRRETA